MVVVTAEVGLGAGDVAVMLAGIVVVGTTGMLSSFSSLAQLS